jgi:hypothetical protein
MQLTPSQEGSVTMFPKHTIRVAVLSLAVLALSASAAQARPLGLGYTQPAVSTSAGYHTFYRPMKPANGAVVVVPKAASAPQASVVTSSDGFRWTTALLGVGIISVVLLLAAAAAGRIRPGRVAQL